MNKCDPRESIQGGIFTFSKLYYACVVNDSRDRTVSFIKDVYVYLINVNNETFGQIVLKRDKDTT